VQLRPHICGGRIVPLRKPDGGVRPIVVGDLLKLLASLIHVNLFDADFYGCFRDSQIAMVSRGLDAAVTTARSWASHISSQHQWMLIYIDRLNGTSANGARSARSPQTLFPLSMLMSSGVTVITPTCFLNGTYKRLATFKVCYMWATGIHAPKAICAETGIYEIGMTGFW